ncbi:DUF4126 family protein [Sphingomonas sp. BN140010]|uniref:DUF4126 family protein n=1 Tax=Sphingomonas arvum TaxID=2992113 RepID=A0ABT3JDF6_9SPHN|nr:DUF4126 family protein [Sphingomonas sp. BN140010]MCW3797115.1 DUF4126 family protein [Sphingomonas sp. BN140010]
MLQPLLLAATAGARSMTPLAAVSVAAARGDLPSQPGLLGLLSNKWVAAGTLALAAGEITGDKMKSAPDRIVLLGLASRLVTGAVSAAALARENKVLAGVLGAGVAVAASYPTFYARVRAMRDYGQTKTGFVEDAAVLGSAIAIVRSAAD